MKTKYKYSRKEMVDIPNHMKQKIEGGEKNLDDLDRLRLIKEWLPDMVSANVELVINMAVRQLRTSSVREFQQMVTYASDPKIKELLNNP